MRNERSKFKIYEVCLVIIGTFMVALAVEMFIIPYNILSGGVAGIAVAISPLIHIDETLIANVLVVGLLFAGGAVLGKQFFLETFLSSLIYPVFTSMLTKMITVPAVDPILASFYGGLLGGIGVGLVVRAGASTGGMDIPPLIVHKLTGIKLSVLISITDALTVMLGFAAYDLSAVLLGLISVFSTGWAVSKALSFGEGSVSKSVQVISPHWQEIYRQIDIQLGRGATVLEAHGMYQMEKRPVLLCVVGQKQYAELLKIINDIDPSAFVITTDATDMHGEGFTYGFHL